MIASKSPSVQQHAQPAAKAGIAPAEQAEGTGSLLHPRPEGNAVSLPEVNTAGAGGEVTDLDWDVMEVSYLNNMHL